jgi:hypothetical protein
MSSYGGHGEMVPRALLNDANETISRLRMQLEDVTGRARQDLSQSLLAEGVERKAAGTQYTVREGV